MSLSLRRSAGLIVALFSGVLTTLSAQAGVKVALMDFSTDDNSYRSIQAAADFANLVQVELMNETNLEWVERAQMSVVKQEFSLAELRADGGLSALRRGRMLGADWIVTGHFASDDRNQATFAVQVIESRYADVIAEAGHSFPGNAPDWWKLAPGPMKSVAETLRTALARARQRQAQSTNQARVAFLFLADTSRWPTLIQNTDILPREFADRLEQVAGTNAGIRLIHFPKAYQSTDEAEQVFDGIIESALDSWSRTADLFVWGTYAMTNTRAATGPAARLDVSLTLWNGIAQPTTLKESLALPARENLPPAQVRELLDRLVRQTLARARPQREEGNPTEVRKLVADSIVKSYVAMSGPGRPGPSIHERKKLAEAVRMLEAACFFDPDNADARVLWLTCRYGWWLDFSSNVKNEFWTKWRRNQAWGKYVERFGLKSAGVKLPFPYDQWGLPTAYLRASREVIERCPQNFDWSESEPHGPMQSAQFHGFPTDMSNAVAARWKAELEAAHWKRLTRVVEFLQSREWTPPTNQPPMVLSDLVREILRAGQPPTQRLELLERIWPECAKSAQRFGPQWIVGAGELANESAGAIAELCAQAGKPERAGELRAMLVSDGSTSGATKAIAKTSPLEPVQKPAVQPAVRTPTQPRPATVPPSQMVPRPGWLKDYMPILSMFKLYPPNSLPREVKPEIVPIQFPARFEVKVIKQMALAGDQLWILAMDQRSAATSDTTPDFSTETLDERNRLWRMSIDANQPTLLKAEALPGKIESFLLKGSEMWLAGDAVGVLGTKDLTYKKFGLDHGLPLKEVEALAVAGGRVFAAGDMFKLSSYDVGQAQWSNVGLPRAHFSAGTDNPYVLAGNQRWLGYVAGTVLFQNVASGQWTNVPATLSARCFAPDGTAFWIGGADGLHHYEPDTRTLRSWAAAKFRWSPMGTLTGNPYLISNPMMRQSDLEQLEAQIRGCLAKVVGARKEAQAFGKKTGTAFDPFNLTARIPGEIHTLANDGDYLWLGVENYFGNYLLLLHKPDAQMVAGFVLGVRDKIASLAVSADHVWIGTAYGDTPLMRLRKDAFLSVPRNQWTSLSLAPQERDRVLQTMTVHDQALYAFLAGDSQQVVQKLGALDPQKASLEAMLLLAWSYDASGVNDPQKARTWIDAIASRYPDSPWAKFAAAGFSNKVAALSSPTGGKEAQPSAGNEPAVDKQTQLALQKIVQRFDTNDDGMLERTELYPLSQLITFRARTLPGSLPPGAGDQELAPLLSERFPSPDGVLHFFDRDRNQKLDATELARLAADLKSK